MDVSLAAPLSALNASSVSQQVTANNLANVNTEEFRASRVTLEDLPAQNGVAVQEIRQDPEAPPSVPSMRLLEQQGRVEQQPVQVSTSTTDVAREMVNLMVNANTYAANVAVARTQDAMVGAVLDTVA